MTFGAPLGLLGLLALPAIVAIHLFRRRYRPTPVTGLFLFGPAVEAAAPGRRRAPLRREASLWLELLAALALTALLSDPHLDGDDAAVHEVIVLDESLRMAARAGADGTALDRARAALEARLDALPRDARVTLVASGPPARVLAGPATSPERALEALRGFAPATRPHDLEPALRLAAELAARGGDGAAGAVLLVSDREPPGLPEGVGLLATGRPLATSGVAEARWLLPDARGGERLLVRVAAHGGTARERELVVSSGARALARQTIELAAEAGATLVLPLPAEARPERLRIALSGPDPLAEDDAVELIRPDAREITATVALTGPARAPVLRALGAATGVRVAQENDANLLFVDHLTDVALQHAGAWEVAIAGAGGPPALGPFLAARGDALLAGLDFTGAVWVGGDANATAPGQALLVAGDQVLLRDLPRPRGQRAVALALDAGAGTLTAHPAWPALIDNLVRARRAALPGPERRNVGAGEQVAVTLPLGERQLVVTAPGQEGPVEIAADADGRVLLPGFERAGEATLALGTAAAPRPWERLTVAVMDADLGDLRDAAALAREPVARDDARVARRRDPVTQLLYLVVACAAALGAWWFARREAGGASVGAEEAAWG